MNVPKRVPAFASLVSLTLEHPLSTTRAEVNRFCTLVRRLIAGSRLRALTLTTPNLGIADLLSPHVAHDALLAHLCARHAGRLETLHAPHVFFRRRAVLALAQKCRRLRSLSILLPKRAMVGSCFFCKRPR
jgi:hypothetical protein